MYAEVAGAYSKEESCLREIVKKEKESCASFAVTPQTAQVAACCVVSAEVSMETAPGWGKDKNRRCVPIVGNVLGQKA